MSWTPPERYSSRPVAILGAGVLGRRIACTWAAAGYNVNVRDPDALQRSRCLQYVEENIAVYRQKTSSPNAGVVQVFDDLEKAVADAWLIIEAVPEKIELKISTFVVLEEVAPSDCILATNSSSYKSSEMINGITDSTKHRVLNTHYYMPPTSMVVELMTSGFTEALIFPFLVARLKETGASPYVARKESTGFIFNRVWAAVKREVLTILSEGVSVPEEIDSIWTEIFIEGGTAPCRAMDHVGLDTVSFIESHYIAERKLSSAPTVDYLESNYLRKGKLGAKSAAGGLYPPTREPVSEKPRSSETTLLVLDIGLAAAEPTHVTGEILQFSTETKKLKTLLSQQSLPDGIDIDESGRMFWTAMGIPGKSDGAVYSANTDGSDIRTLVPPGAINTPKQLCLDTTAKKVYFADREGCSIYRCDYDGSALEMVVENGVPPANVIPRGDVSKWCVGIAVSPARGKFYWTQKGPSKGGEGRVFCANIITPVGQTAASREDIICLADRLPEPIDLAVDETQGKLYWTDRGEIPYGNSLNVMDLEPIGVSSEEGSRLPTKPRILTRNFKEAIGLALDVKNGRVYVTDLGGFIYSVDMDGKNKKVLYSDEYRAFAGVTII